MSCECSPSSNLGCFPACSPINTGVLATATGTWKARVCFNGVFLEQEFAATAGEPLVIPNKYPDGLLLGLQLIQPDGQTLATKYSFTIIFTRAI